ncbi:MAG: aldo/keto reductase, partial [Bacillota bacterium]
MEYRQLGNTKLNVSRLVLGTLTMGPLQANLGLDEGAALIRAAMGLGVNLLDTAEVYDNYPYIKRALRGVGEECMVATKSFAYEWAG